MIDVVDLLITKIQFSTLRTQDKYKVFLMLDHH